MSFSPETVSYVPQWIGYSKQTTNSGKLVNRLTKPALNFWLRNLYRYDLFGSTDVKLSYWTIALDSPPDSVTLNGNVVAEVASFSNGIVPLVPAWFWVAGTIHLFNLDLIKLSANLNGTMTLPNRKEFTPVYLDSGKEIFIGDLDYSYYGYYDIYYRSTNTPQISINEINTELTEVELQTVWDQAATELWSIPLSNQAKQQGSIQATEFLYQPESLISAALFGVQASYWDGATSISGTGSFDTDFQAVQTYNYLIGSTQEFYLQHSPTYIEVTSNNNVLTPSEYTLTGNKVVLNTFRENLSVRYLIESFDRTTLSPIPTRVYPVFNLVAVSTINEKEALLTRTWNEPNYNRFEAGVFS